MTSQLSTLSCELRESLMYLAYFSDILSMDFCTTKHWQTSGPLVQELNVCTVRREGTSIIVTISAILDIVFHQNPTLKESRSIPGNH